MRTMSLAAALAVAAGGAATAQDFRGAELSAEVLGFTEDLDLGETAYRGSAEFGLFGNVALGADLSYHGFRSADAECRNLTLHALYDLGAATTGGLFYGRDDLDGGSASAFGFEAGTTFAGAGIEGYLGRLDGDGDDGAILGVDATYGLARFGLTGNIGVVTSDASTVTRLAAGAEVPLGLGPTLYGEVGRLDVEGDGATFVTLGARVAIGPNRGTTFGPRGLFEVLTAF